MGIPVPFPKFSWIFSNDCAIMSWHFQGKRGRSMNDKEIGEIRRHLRRDRSNITKIYGCFVNDNKEIITEFSQSTGIMPENEGDKYFALFKRVLSGAIGKNLIDIAFRPDQVLDGDQHALLTALKNTALKVDQAVEQLLQQGHQKRSARLRNLILGSI